MTQYCDYHPVHEAIWACDQCRSLYCHDCLPGRVERRATASCPNCAKALGELPPEFSKLSLWQCCPEILALPLKRPLVLFAFAVVAIVMALQTLVGGLLPAGIVSAAMALSYGSIVAGALARGAYTDFSLPSPGVLSHPLVRDEVLAIVAQTLTVLLITVWLAHTGSFFTMTVFLVGTFFILPPLSVAVLSRSRRKKVQLLNRFMQVIGYLGPNYMVLAVLGTLIAISGTIVTDFMSAVIPAPFTSPSVALVTVYCVLIWCAALGFATREVLKQRGLPADTRRAYSKTKVLDAKLDLALINGDYERVIHLLEQEYARSQVPDFRLDQLYRLLVAQNNWPVLFKHCYALIVLMLSRGRMPELMTYLKGLRRFQPDFNVRDAALCRDLVKACVQSREPKLVLWLAKDAHIRFPENREDVVEIYRHAGKTLHQEFNQPLKALAYLRYASKMAQGLLHRADLKRSEKS